MPPLPAFFLLLFLLAGVVPPTAAQSPPAVSLQPGGMLTMMEHAVPTEVHFNGRGNYGLDGAVGIAVSGDGALLFVTAAFDGALSVWRVNAEAGTLTQTRLHEDATTGSLNGAEYLAVSGDGKFLFVTAYSDHTLSVWRVNAEAGTLMRYSVYHGGPDGTRGLFGLRGIVVSGDLLFVTADAANTLGVWRVNAEEGTLILAALYQDSRVEQDDGEYIENVNGRVDGLMGATGVAVSGDGKLLFVTAPADSALSVWRVNAGAGTLSQTALYQDPDAFFPINEVDGRVDGLGRARNAAVSGDGTLLFVTAFSSDALSVWRVNAEAGTLSRTALYQDSGAPGLINEVDGRVDGLRGAWNAAVSGDGALLFVTANTFNNSALSVWRVNAEAGTLSQTALYREGNPEIDGLGGAKGVAVSGDLLFVTADTDNALSVWQINNAEVPLEAQTVIRVQSDLPVAEEVVVTVTAQSGANMVEATATLSPSTRSADAIFPPGTLRPGGRWIFTAQASPPTALDTGAARIAMQVLPPLLSLEPQQDQFVQGSTVVLTVRTIAGLSAAASFDINAIKETTATITVEYSAGDTEQEVLFPAEDIAMFGLGQLDFFFRLPDDSPFRVGDGPAATVQIVIPRLQLVPLPELLALGSTVILTVRANPVALTEATYNIIARNLTSPTTFSMEVMHPAGDTEREVSFSAQQIASPGQWEFSIQLPEGSPFQVTANGTATVYVAPVLSLRLQGEAFFAGDSLTIEVQAESPPAVAATVTITAQRQQDGVDVAATEAVMLSPAPEVLSGQAVFPAGALGAGEWVFTAQSEPPQALYTANARAEAAVLPPPLMLEVSAPSTVIAGSTFGVTVRTTMPVPAETAVSVMVTFEGTVRTEMLSAGEATATVAFTAPGTTGTFTVNATGTARATETGALVPGVIPSSASVEVVPLPVMLTLFPASSLQVTANTQFSVELSTNPPLPAGTEVNVQLQFNGASRPAVVSSTMPAPSVMFTAPSSGTLSLTASVVNITQSSPVVAVSAPEPVTVQVTELLTFMLTVSAPPSVTVGSPFTVTVEVAAETPLPAGVSVNATVSFGAADSEVIIEKTDVTLSAEQRTVTADFTAPNTAGSHTVETSVTATMRTDPNAPEVAVPEAVTRAVAVSALDVQLVLSEFPDLVAASSTFTVTVGTEPALPEDTAVQVTVSLATFSSEPVTLTASNPTASVPVMAPAAGGAAMLTAAGGATADSTLELNVLAAEAVTVQVQVQVSLSLRLEAPPEVTARDSFAVTVSAEPEVPGEATVTVTVVFDGMDSSPVALSAEVPSTTVILTAGRIGTNLELVTSSVVTVAEPNALQVVVADADASVNAVAQSVELTLMVSPQRVNIDEEIEVTVGVAPALLADTTLTVEVMADTASEAVILTDATPSRQVRFTAVAAGPLEVSARVSAVAPADLVTVENTPMQTVQVREEGTVDLTLDAPKSVTVGDTFTVTVGVAAETLLPTGSSVSATVSFSAVGSEDMEVVLIPGAPSTAVILTAPRRSGIFMVEVNGSVEDNSAIRFVVDTSAQVSVEPVRVMLTLRGPDAVTVDETYQVMVGTNMAVPAGTVLEVTVSDGTTSRVVSLTEENAAEEVSFMFTAPASAGPVTVTATATVQTDENALEVAAPAAKAVTVQVQLQVLRLELQQGQPLTAGSMVMLTMQLDRELSTTISYTVIARNTSVMVLNTVSEMTTSVLTMHPAGTTEHSVSFSGQQIASPGQWEFSILPAELPFESVPTMATISLDFIQPQELINADDLVFALRYLVRCGGSAEGCQANGEDLASLARNLGNELRIEQLPAALQLLDLSGGGEERPAANWFTLLLGLQGLQGLPVELLFPDSEEPLQLENAIRSVLSVQEE